MNVIEIKVPELAESISEGTIAQWLKNVGDNVKKGDNIVELETDKVNIEISADYDGIIQEVLREEGDTVEVGDVIAVLKENGEAGGEATQAPEAAESKKEAKQPAVEPIGTAQEKQPQETQPAEERKETDRPLASPAARKLARELGIDLSKVEARDPLGRVRPEDVKAASEKAAQPEQKAAKAPEKKPASAPKTADVPGKPVERVKLSRRRQTIAKRLVEVQQTAAMLTTFNEVDMTAINDIRKRRKDAFLQQNDVKLGYMSFFTKAVVGALKQFPLLNAEIQGDEVLLKKFYDIGIAVGAEEGLVVPVVRDADKLSFAGIEKEILSLGKKARDNKLTLSELQGGTFTITNGGIFGSLMSTPILNAPQVGILGMHGIKLRPVAIDAERMENRPMMYIALSYDHRIVDGREAVSFLAKVKEMLEDPESLLLQG